MTNDERSRLDVIESKVDTVLLKLEYLSEARQDHEKRLRSVEVWKYAIPLSLVTMVLTFIGSIFYRG